MAKPKNGTQFAGGSTFIILRTGIFEHLADGKLSPLQFTLYCIIHHKAKWSTGQWRGTCEELCYALGGQYNLSTVTRAFKFLCEHRYLKSFNKWGRRGGYGVLINKYEPRIGAFKGRRLNIDLSSDYHHPVFDILGTSDEDTPGMCIGDAEDTPTIRRGSAEDTPSIQDVQDGVDVSGSSGSKDGEDASSSKSHPYSQEKIEIGSDE